jgi:hypothetical protein
VVTKALTVRFDYDSVEKEAKGKLVYLAGQIKKESASHTRTGIAIGESVAKAHEILAGDGRDGQFSQWVEAECGFSKRTAYNYMNAWQTFGKSESIEQYEPTAMYTLSGSKVPPDAVKEAEKLAKKGERITAEKADEILGKFRDVAKKTSAKQANGATSVQRLHTSEPSASVSGTGNNPPSADPPSLPSVGTVNQTETGSQGDGDAGECPKGNCRKGGNHTFEDGACSKCLEPDDTPIPEVVPIDPNGFDRENIEAHAESFAANFAARVKAHNLAIERFARAIMEAFADPPESVWLDESRLGIAQDQIKSACATIRQAKAHDQPCPKCDGKGSHTGKPCKWCKGVGFLPERSYEMAGGK